MLEEILTIEAADATNPRFDIIYINAAGSAAVVKGTAAAILPTGESTYKKMTTPYPSSSVPSGVILARIYVAANVTTIVNAAIDDIAMFAGQVPIGILTTRGDLAYRDANTWGRLPKSTTQGHSLLQGANDPYWGYPSHTTLSDIGSNTHATIDTFISSKAAASGLASLDSGSVCAQDPKIHATRHQSGGADAIKLDDLSAPDDTTDLNATTAKHGLMMKYPNTAQTLKGDGTWITRKFEVAYTWGDGSAVITAGRKEFRIPIACKITGGSVRAIDNTSGTITYGIYKRAITSDSWTQLGSNVTMTSSKYKDDTGWSETVAAGELISILTSSISSLKQVLISLTFEAT